MNRPDRCEICQRWSRTSINWSEKLEIWCCFNCYLELAFSVLPEPEGEPV